ncbi:BAR-domain-containing protein [Lindgomyces ingoldianus]|uniref:BAR-domain-containing protein n=1 Tax=Lindgomyces ingoldianus TaxID=673940 RepID=A0ACB6QB60_9PLEO|nr:BAR-domain-containing protein [Lindgomyces ingoldianus]KAF2463735.1 BAR-domain-containing protein [Lindgomyces ingoldianus]
MLVNKKLDRFKQWAGEKMGGEVKTGLSDEFKSLEMEMNLRHEGMEKMQKSMTVYVKSLSKREEGDNREKSLPGGYLGSAMVTHSEDFEPDSEFGNCLSSLGRANERLARVQETYVSSATSTWLEGLERSLAQMKEYQNARKKLEQRRLAYDTSLVKMQKAKKEDFRVEEELRSQKAKFEESSEDVFRRMQDIKESEVDMIQDLTQFLEAELTYYDRCREILLNVKRDWPARDAHRPARSRSNTATRGYAERFTAQEEEPPMPEQPRITIPKLSSRNMSPAHDTQSPGGHSSRPAYSRTTTFDGPSRSQREMSPAPRLSRVPTEPTMIMANRANLRPVRQTNTFADDYEDEYPGTNGHRRDRSPPSPATSQGSAMSRAASWTASELATTGKKAPPPPPPSRAKKPPPPPPPMKRSALSASETSHY